VLSQTTPGTLVELPLTFKVNVEVVIEELSIGSLNVALAHLVSGTFMAPSTGSVLVTVGGVVSDVVVNDQLLTAVIALPAKSFTPVVTVATYVVPGLRLDDDAK
jgi:hypothetical protein